MTNAREKVVTAPGIELEVYKFGNGNKLALLIHGFPERAACWEEQIQMLLDQGYAVWVPNLRGYEGSSVPRKVQDYAVSELLSDMAALVDAAGKEKLLLIGHDAGAMLCWHFALQQVRKVDAMIVMGTFHPANSLSLLQGVQALRSWYIGFFLVPGLPEFYSSMLELTGVMPMLERMAAKDPFYKRIISLFRERMQTPGRMTAMLNHYRAALDPRLWSKAEISALKNVLDIPVLVINGADDPWIGQSLNRGTEKFVRNVTVKVIPDAGHWVHLRAPEEVNQLISDWDAALQRSDLETA